MSLHLMNGHTAARVKSSEGCTVLPCGCAHTDVEHVQLCDEHFAEWETRHESASVDHNFGG